MLINKNVTFILFLGLTLLMSCGDPRTSATLRSPSHIRAISAHYVVGQTTIAYVLDTLGPWNKSGIYVEYGDFGDNEWVEYWTNDGGQTRIDFTLVCPEMHPDCVTTRILDYPDDVPPTHATLRFKSITAYKDE